MDSGKSNAAPEKQQGSEQKGGKQDAAKTSVVAAHNAADHDMEEDPDISIHSPNDDLDEGQTSRLGEDMHKIV